MYHHSNAYQDLSQKKISSLFWQYSLPAIVGSVVNTLYNIIDGVFIGHWVGKEALSGLGVLLPMMNITAAVGMLVGVGAASHLSINLGLQDKDSAERIVGVSFVLTFLLTSITIALLLVFLEPLLMFMGASETSYPYARDFLVIFLPGSLFLTLCFNFNALMRASGYPLKAMITMFISVIANIVLAPIFILLLGWGMKGAALATTISMAIGFGFVIAHFFRQDSNVRFYKKYLSLPRSIVKSIISIGLSPFFMQLAASVVIILINYQLHSYAVTAQVSGDAAIAAFANTNRLIFFAIMVLIGLTQGMQPIIGYNYGTRDIPRVIKTLMYAIKIATIISTAAFLLSFFMPHTLVAIFSPDPEIINLSATALRYVSLAFALVGFQVIVSSFFQCIGMARKSIFLSLTRQVLFLIPALLILPACIGLNGVWLASPLSDTLSALLAAWLLKMQLYYFKRCYRHKNSTC